MRFMTLLLIKALVLMSLAFASYDTVNTFVSLSNPSCFYRNVFCSWKSIINADYKTIIGESKFVLFGWCSGLSAFCI